MWRIFKKEYFSLRGAVEATDRKMLSDPRIAAALIQIDMASAFIDRIMSDREDQDED